MYWATVFYQQSTLEKNYLCFWIPSARESLPIPCWPKVNVRALFLWPSSSSFKSGQLFSAIRKCSPRVFYTSLPVCLPPSLSQSLPQASFLFFQEYVSFVAGPLCIYTLSSSNVIPLICQKNFIKHRSHYGTLPISLLTRVTDCWRQGTAPPNQTPT